MTVPEFTRRVLMGLFALMALVFWLISQFTSRDAPAPLARTPLIGIPQTTSTFYADAVRSAGGKPIYLAYETAEIPSHLEKLDGILLPGGADIDPSFYGEERHPTTHIVDPERYEFESALAKAWLDQTEKPYLGVCLGCQMLNVIQGGTLIQDIPDELGSDHRVGHSIEVDEASILYSIIGKKTAKVNSNHHQAVKDLGKGLKVTAKSPADGVIEAIEWADGSRFIVGVQWHPERMKDDEQKQIFKEFVKAAVQTPTQKVP